VDIKSLQKTAHFSLTETVRRYPKMAALLTVTISAIASAALCKIIGHSCAEFTQSGWSEFQPDFGKNGKFFGDWSLKRFNSVRVQKLLADPSYDCFYEVIKYNENSNQIKDPRLGSNEELSLRAIFERDNLHPFWRGVELVKWVALSVLTLGCSPLLLIDFFDGKDFCKTFCSQHIIRWNRVVKGKETQIFEMFCKVPRSHIGLYLDRSEENKTYEKLIAPGGVKILVLGDLLCGVWYNHLQEFNKRHPFIQKGVCIVQSARDVEYNGQ